MQENFCSQCGNRIHHSDSYPQNRSCDCHRRHNRSHHCGCGHRDHHQGGGCCHHHSYRRSICDDNFRLRLGGLQNGLNFRLRQLVGSTVEVRLENDELVQGKIYHVGSNFVELIVGEDRTSFPDTEDESEQDNEETEIESEDTQDQGEKSHSLIFSTDKINDLKHLGNCSTHCRCH
ncbi:hypothetical protein [Ornithinibacillus californiensis]|uniref:hypothetical protein n=1 Tax=Ornithinibacillus californiensis TaxID=161536 RepID=UPI0012EE5891|nr:hypothetical protein [Ornithinibacillus californiensis]